jgi:hypothetical protein
VLRALRRLLRPGGRIAFTTITISPDLSPSRRRRARRAGPRAVAARADTASMLGRAGFVDIDVVDVTADFERTALAWLDESDRNADQLEAAAAPGVFRQAQSDRRAQLAAVEDGLLRRVLASAVRTERAGASGRR